MDLMFYFFGGLAVLGALAVLVLRSPVYCALALVGSFFCLGVVYILLNSEFIAAVQVLVYAGAIMVLFLFVIMLLNVQAEARFPFTGRLPQITGLALAVSILTQLVGLFRSPLVGPKGVYPVERIAEEGSVEVVGQLLFTDYVLAFEVISILLLVAVVGAVVLAKRRVKSETGENA
ncbi:MAG: NADH-quinone oxidoreductase subunit J [Deltaproteobacteria bacterium]|nr:NADH-quinone oxidoreductase subunit J [Deltaproteobacteria bacterium]